MMESFGTAALRQEIAKLHERLDSIESKIDALTRMIAPPTVEVPASPASPTFSVPEGVLHLLQSGQKQQAIDAYQQLAGVDARTAEAVVSSLSATKPKTEAKADSKKSEKR